MNGDVFKGKISEDFYKNTVNDGRYDDIIDMAHHVSKDRPHMSQAVRTFCSAYRSRRSRESNAGACKACDRQ